MGALDVLQKTPTAIGTVVVTEAASKAIQKYLLEHKAPDEAGLRIGVRGGGCSGLSYFLDVETEIAPNDHIVDAPLSVKVFIDPKSLLFLQGSTLDYVSGLMESGFKFHNPKAGRGCGCGESFSPS
ncbi:MAG: iron-sulfur cluster assembly accessory protein [Myxococcales bacterium]|nr:iron-sulfur cluster assembly accessory protein [Myxococcales bacterium]